MSKFDTHGGYFAPKDYLKVNEGGSHEENPNGGVQIGVDPEGNPNLLEEGEPVYKDYVYSDNITAEKEFLEKNNLPGKYDGKLYSKIADDILSEAEERPLDPISRNGLEALLGRLAEAQEGQKQAKEQKDLEDELANLSPEELDQLEAMLAQEQPVGEDNSMYGDGPVGALGEPGISPESVQQSMAMPMMANGGFLRMFDGGGPLTEEQKQAIIEQGPLLDGSNVRVPSLLEMALGSDNKIVQGVNSIRDAYDDWRNNSTIGGIVDALIPRDATQAFAPLGRVGKAAYSAADIETQVAKWSSEYDIAQKAYNAAREIVKTGKDAAGNAVASDVAKAGLEKAKSALNLAKGEFRRWSGMKGMSPKATEVVEEAVPEVEATVKEARKFPWWKVGLIASGVSAGAAAGKKYIYDPLKDVHDNKSATPATSDDFMTYESPSDTINLGSGDFDFGFLNEKPEYEKKFGGEINKFDGFDSSWLNLMRQQRQFANPWAASIMRPNSVGSVGSADSTGSVVPVDSGSYYIPYDRSINGREFEAQDYYKAFLDMMLANRDSEDAKRWMNYIQNEIQNAKSKYRLNGFQNWYDLATDKLVGPVHQATKLAAEKWWNDLQASKAASATAAQNPQVGDISELSPRMAYAMGLTGDNKDNSSQYTFGPYGEVMSLVNPSQALAADMATKREAAVRTMGLVNPSQATAARMLAYPATKPGAEKNDDGTSGNGNNNTGTDPMPVLPTWPRYAGAIGSGLLGLYNAFQSPDKYRQRQLQPYLPEGRIHLQNQVYNPIDQNMVANAISAQGNATARALRNSGLGPSSASAILATDNNTTGNLGTGFLQTWDANNQRRNAVIAGNNQAEAQRANFDWTVDAARKKILNDTAYINGYNDLNVQRLNYGAEGDKYKAISNQISNGLQALSGIGKENFAMNQVNTNPAFLGYGVGANGMMFYNPKTGQWEIKEKK